MSPRLALTCLSLTACARGTAPAATAPTPTPPVSIEASVDKAVATTGDVITYAVVIERRADLDVSLPEPGSEIAGLRLVDAGRDAPTNEPGRVRERRWYKLRADLVGSYVVPAVTVTWKEGDTEQRAETSQIFIEVASVLPEGAELGDLRDIKPLRPLVRTVPWAWLARGAVLLGLGAAALLWWRQRKRKRAPPEPPQRIAYAALDRLRRTDFDDPVAVRRYYFEISAVLRAYVEGRYGLNATDLTTEEILARLSEAQLAADLVTLLQTFLLDTDQVKFAGRTPSTAEIEQVYERALRFVEATEPQEETPGGAAEAQRAA